MKKLIPLLMIPFASHVLANELPEKNANGNFENINNMKEYRYEIYPDLTFWYEAGRPFWKSTTESNDKLSMTKERITFDMEEKELDIIDRVVLKNVAKNILKNKDMVEEVVVKGHASKPGKSSFNMELSEDRAEAVRSFLIEQGVSSELIKVKALGEKMPLETVEKSRRVEIILAQN